MQLAEGGAGYNPAGWLYEPTPGDPVPTTFDGVIGVADWLSLGHWALVVLDKVDGDFDLVEKVQTWVAGDWEHVAVSAEAIRHLKLFTTDMADAVDAYSGLLDDVWDGNAAQAADLTFISITTSMRKAADMLDIAAKGYDDVAQGLYGVAKDVGNLVQTLIDLLIAAGISAAATAAGSWTLIGAAIGTAATYYGITKIVSTIQKIIAVLESAVTFVDTFTDVVLGALGSAGDWHSIDIPDAFHNNLVH